MTEAYYNLLYDVLRAYNRCTPSKVLRLRNDQVFVFGTDAKGSQRYGAAGLAAKKKNWSTEFDSVKTTEKR